METIARIKPLTIILLICITYSCSETKREGLAPNRRNYSRITTKLPANKLIPSDMVLRMKHADRNSVFKSVRFLTDSVFGKAFELELKHSGLEDELEAYLSDGLESLENEQLKVDKKSLQFHDRQYFNSDSIDPFRSFGQFIGYNDEPFRYQIAIGRYELNYRVEVVLSPLWERIGEYKQVFDDGEKRRIGALHGYGQLLTLVIDLSAKDTKSNKTEYYRKLLTDESVQYTAMNYTDAEFLMSHFKH